MTIREILAGAVLLALLFFLLYEAGRMLSPYFAPLLLALTVAIVFYPMHAWVQRRLHRFSDSLQAFASTLLILIFIVGPVTWVVIAMFQEGLAILPDFKSHLFHAVQWIRSVQAAQSTWMDYLPDWLTRRVNLSSIPVEQELFNLSQTLTRWVAARAAIFAGGVLGLVIDQFLFLFTLFFFFRDGVSWFESWNKLLPFTSEQRQRLHAQVRNVVTGIFRGTILTALLQGLFVMIGYAVAGVPAAALLGCLTILASVVPAFGTALIWAPTCVFYTLTGSYAQAVIIAVFGIIASLLDNFLRPLLAGSRARIPLFWLTISLLGGLQLYGMKGLLLGPLVFAVLPILLEMYRVLMSKAKPN